MPIGVGSERESEIRGWIRFRQTGWSGSVAWAAALGALAPSPGSAHVSRGRPTRSRVQSDEARNGAITHEADSAKLGPSARPNQVQMTRGLRPEALTEVAPAHSFSRQAARPTNVNSSAQRTRMRARCNASPGVNLIRCPVLSSPAHVSSTTRGLAGRTSSRSSPNRNGAAL